MDKQKLYRSAYNPKYIMRAMDPSSEDSKEQKITGLALRFNEPTVLFSSGGIDYLEVIDPHALDNCDMSDVVLTRNHNNDRLLARTKNGTLQLSVTSEGLEFTAELADTQLGEDTFKLIKRGDIDGCSFGGYVEEESYNVETHTRTILKMSSLFDISAVTFPAYESTNVEPAVRAAFGIEAAEEEVKKLELAEAKRKLLLKI